jgi:hypothetical protein
MALCDKMTDKVETIWKGTVLAKFVYYRGRIANTRMRLRLAPSQCESRAPPLSQPVCQFFWVRTIAGY